DVAVAEAEDVDAEGLRAGERAVKRGRTVDADQQRRRVEAQRADGSGEDAVAPAAVARGDRIDRRRDVAHGHAKGIKQFTICLEGLGHTLSMRCALGLCKRQKSGKWQSDDRSSLPNVRLRCERCGLEITL